MRSKKCVPLILIIIFNITCVYWIYISQSESIKEKDQRDAAKSCQKTNLEVRLNEHNQSVDALKRVVESRLRELRNGLVDLKRTTHSQEQRHKLFTQLYVITQIIQIVNPNLMNHPESIIDDDIQIHKINPLKEICPEEFKGKKTNYGYPLFRIGFGPIKCNEYKPIETLITVIIQIPAKYKVDESLRSIARYYPGIKIILMTDEALSNATQDLIKTLNITIKHHVVNDDGLPSAWNSSVYDIETPYVLIAPSMTLFDDDVILERLVRMLSYHENLAVAGGAIRNVDGKWDIGCEQVTFRNWTAWYKGGYHRSFNECVVCDHLKGPFAVKTEILRNMKFDTSMKTKIFHDLFWRVKRRETLNLIVSCPDVMFNVISEEKEDIEFVAFADKHNIHKIVETNGRVRWYGCRKTVAWAANKNCERINGIALSPASMENLADGIKYLMKVCDDIGAICELLDGTMIGAVKLNGVLPWEIDADIAILVNNFTAFRGLVDQFKEAGFTLRPGVIVKRDSDGKYSEGYMVVMAGGFQIQIWSHPEKDMAATRGEAPTRVQFAGQWLSVARNPGLYVRNHYGYEMYKHVEHWLGLGLKTSWEFYNAGKYRKCPKPGHSACLDQYSPDGNIQFRDHPGY